jgi:MFS family permease
MSDQFFLRLRVFVPFALGYFLSYLYRLVNAVIAPNLTSDFSLGPAELGLLTSAYFISFAAFQLPLGVLLDRFGPRRIEAALLLCAGSGAMVFGNAESLLGLVAGRALIGLGVSSCLMAAFKAFTLWFPSQQWTRINGLQLAAGGLGALSATVPVEAALQFTDWRGVFLMLAAATAAVAVSVFGCVPEKTQEADRSRLGDQLKGIGQVFTSPVFWRVAPLATFSQATYMSIISLWAGPWLRDNAGLDRSGAAQVLLWAAAAMTAGYIVMGLLAEWLGRHGVKTMDTGLWGMTLFMAVQAWIILGPGGWAPFAWAAFGFIGTAGVIPYPALTMSFPAHLAGRVNTGLNLLVFVAAFAAQWGIGGIIDLFPVTAGGTYALQGYQLSFGIMLGLQVVCLLWYFGAERFQRRAKYESQQVMR